MTMFLAAIGWLALGSGGLLWAIAFTSDTRSLSIALVVWSLAFVVPTIIATLAAYREDLPLHLQRRLRHAPSHGRRHGWLH